MNAYNDGPNETGGCLGPFYELESLSPALALAPGEEYLHVHRTFHFTGARHHLDALCRRTLQVSLNDIESAFDG